MDLVGFDEAVFRAHRRRLRGASPQSSPSTTITAIPISARAGDNVSIAERAHALVFRAVPARAPRSGRAGEPRRRRAVPHAGAVGLPAEPEFPRLCRAGRLRPRRASATRSWSPPPAATSRVARILRRRRRSATSAVAGQSVMLTLADEVDISRGDRARPRRDARPQLSDQFAAASRLDGRRAAAARPAVSPEEHDAHRAGAGDRAEIPLRRRHARAQRREGAGAERDRRRQPLRPPSRSPSIPMPRTARPAASS